MRRQVQIRVIYICCCLLLTSASELKFTIERSKQGQSDILWSTNPTRSFTTADLERWNAANKNQECANNMNRDTIITFNDRGILFTCIPANSVKRQKYNGNCNDTIKVVESGVVESGGEIYHKRPKECYSTNDYTVRIWYQPRNSSWKEFRLGMQYIDVNVNTIIFKKSANWSGLMLEFYYSCNNSPKERQCVTVKFVGKREYPINGDLASILQIVESTIIPKTTMQTLATKQRRPPSSNTGVIAGVVVAILVLILIIIAILFFLKRKKRKKDDKKHLTPAKTSAVKMHIEIMNDQQNETTHDTNLSTPPTNDTEYQHKLPVENVESEYHSPDEQLLGKLRDKNTGFNEESPYDPGYTSADLNSTNIQQAQGYNKPKIDLKLSVEDNDEEPGYSEPELPANRSMKANNQQRVQEISKNHYKNQNYTTPGNNEVPDKENKHGYSLPSKISHDDEEVGDELNNNPDEYYSTPCGNENDALLQTGDISEMYAQVDKSKKNYNKDT